MLLAGGMMLMPASSGYQIMYVCDGQISDPGVGYCAYIDTAFNEAFAAKNLVQNEAETQYAAAELACRTTLRDHPALGIPASTCNLPRAACREVGRIVLSTERCPPEADPGPVFAALNWLATTCPGTGSVTSQAQRCWNFFEPWVRDQTSVGQPYVNEPIDTLDNSIESAPDIP